MYSVLCSPSAGVLTAVGKEYARDLADYIFVQEEESLEGKARDILLLAGALSVHESTTEYLRERYSCYNTALLNELRAGDFQAVKRADLKKHFPAEYEKREKDKLRYRYPGVGGESYLDVIERVSVTPGLCL